MQLQARKSGTDQLRKQVGHATAPLLFLFFLLFIFIAQSVTQLLLFPPFTSAACPVLPRPPAQLLFLMKTILKITPALETGLQ